MTDETIPITLGEELFAAAHEPKTFITMPGLGHNAWPSEASYDALDRFLSDLSDL